MSDFKRERKYMVPDGWLRAIDEELVMTCNGTADYEDDYDTAKRKLDQLIQWHIAVATDPKVNGGFSLQQADKVQELEKEVSLWKSRANQLAFPGDGQTMSDYWEKVDALILRNQEATPEAMK